MLRRVGGAAPASTFAGPFLWEYGAVAIALRFRRFWCWCLAITCYALAAPASATPEDHAALQKVSVAMRGDYAAGRVDRAEPVLLGTDQACADRCSARVKAQIWLYIGSVRGTGSGNQDGARAAFEQALGLDSSLAPDPAYTNEETSATYRAVRARMDLGPYAKSVAHLGPLAAKAEQPVQVAPLADDEYRCGDPVPRGYHVETGPRTGMVIGGGIVLGIGHFGAIMGAAESGFDESYWGLALPVLGPWIFMATHEDGCGGRLWGQCMIDSYALLVLDGVIQATGATLLVVGLSARTAHLVPDKTAPVTISPIRLGRSAYGLAVAGAF
jgi:hypothetical protein